MVVTRSGLSLAYVRHMNKLARAAFERADGLDPTLTMDGLNEFLPAELDSEADSSLAVNTLQEFFAEEQPAPRVTNTSELEDYFKGLETAPELADDDGVALADSEFCAETAEVAAENPGSPSEIQRAVQDFHRFAEKFHAFATQCQRQRAAL